MPILSYCSPSWFPHTQTKLKQLVSIEHKFLRLASKKTEFPMHYFKHDYMHIRQILQLPKLDSPLIRQDCLVSYKIANRLFSSTKINELLPLRNITYNIRNPLPVEQRVIRRNYLMGSSTGRLRSRWNNLPASLRESRTLPIFRSRLKTYYST